MQSLHFPTWRTAPEFAPRLGAFVRDSLRLSGCEVLHLSDPRKTPFLISYESPMTGRTGAVCYAAPLTTPHPAKGSGSTLDFEVRSGPSDSAQPEFWKDPSGVFTTVVVGIDPTRGFFGKRPTNDILSRTGIVAKLVGGGGEWQPSDEGGVPPTRKRAGGR